MGKNYKYPSSNTLMTLTKQYKAGLRKKRKINRTYRKK